MEGRRTCFIVLVVSLAVLVADVNAGWKFWKKETTTTTTTTPTPALANSGVAVTPGGKPSTAGNTNQAIAGASDPGLAIGVGSTGEAVRQSGKPSRQNSGTRFGLDVPLTPQNKPNSGRNNGQNYRDWAVDLTGAGEPGRESPKLPAQGPALTSGGQPSQGNKPGSQVTGAGFANQRPGSPTTGDPNQRPGSQVTGAGFANQRPGSLTTGGIPNAQQGGSNQRPGSQVTGAGFSDQRPGSPRPGSPASGGSPNTHQGGSSVPQRNPNPQPTQDNTYPGHSNGKPQVSTVHLGPLKPAGNPTPSPRPGSPTLPASPTGGKSFAEVAGGGSRPGSPTPSPRQPGNPARGQQRPQGSSEPTNHGRPSAGTIATGGVLAGGALAGGAIAAGTGNSAGSSTGAQNPQTGNKLYSSNPTYSTGKVVTDEDLEKLSEALFIKDANNANQYITLNLQKQTTANSPNDEAPQPLFNVNSAALQGTTVQKVIAIFDNYNLDTKTHEHISPLQRQEESLLIDTFLSTSLMSSAMRFLAEKGYVKKDYYDYKDKLRMLWFDLFSRGEGKLSSSGFEHVFLSELKPATTGTEVLGLHNWIYYSTQESANHADYLGYIKKVDLGNKASILKIHTKFNGHDKPVTTMFVGTSPELEMALYTVCFLTRAEQNCPISLGGTKLNIVTHKFRYRGKDLIGTAYPEI